MHYVYILECADGTLYTGYATDVARRVEAHNRGKGAKYTRSRLPVRLAYSEPQPTRGDALRREAAIKKLPRAKKLALIQTLRHSPTQHNRHSPTQHNRHSPT